MGRKIISPGPHFFILPIWEENGEKKMLNDIIYTNNLTLLHSPTPSHFLKDIIVNLYKLHFPSSSFFLQPNKKVFHSPTFLPLQPNIYEEKPNLFYPSTFSLHLPFASSSSSLSQHLQHSNVNYSKFSTLFFFFWGKYLPSLCMVMWIKST